MEKREVIDLLAKFVPRTTLFFDVIAAEHCNLNCKGCTACRRKIFRLKCI